MRTRHRRRRGRRITCRQRGGVVKRKAYFIVGMGCNSSGGKRFMLSLEEQILDIDAFTDVSMLCNQSSLRTFFNIGKSMCSFHPAKTSEFVLSVVTLIKKDLEDPDTYVWLGGHSYGGAVVSRVAEHIQATGLPENALRRIHFQTFGAIYICPGDRVRDLQIHHIMKLGDVALKCLNIKPNPEIQTEHNDDDNNITYYEKPVGRSAWQIHNSYNFDIIRFFTTATPPE
jgi:hypothetical protein